MAAEVPGNVLYTKLDQWIRVDGRVGVLGITQRGQRDMGQVARINNPCNPGDKLDVGGTIAEIEAIDAYTIAEAPVSGEVVEFNQELEAFPDTINMDPYDSGWIVKIRIDNFCELNSLLSPEDYQKFIDR